MTVAGYCGPRLMHIGGGAVRDIAATVHRLGCVRPLVVTDPFMVSSGLLERATAPMRAAGLGIEVFADTVPDPTTEVVDAGVVRFKDGGHDCLVAFGGGSPIDTAKAIAILAAGGGTMRDWKVPTVADHPAAPPIVAVPTTAGTGSEVTRACVITDTETNEKMLIMGLAAQPAAALIDYELTLQKPLRLTADTGIDSLTHAIEAFVSKKANPFSDMVAKEAMRLIWSNLRTACAAPDNRAAREAMMRGATLGGMAFSNASVALVHGMSRPIGAHFHVPHGLSNAMLLPRVTAFSAPAAKARYAEIARTMGVADPGTDDAMAVGHLVDALATLNADLEVPTPKSYGIDETTYFDLMPLMAEQALASGSPGNNPRVPSADEIVALYTACWASNA